MHSRYNNVAVDIPADVNAASFIKCDILICLIVQLYLWTNYIRLCFSTEDLLVCTNAQLPLCWEACLTDVAHLN